jgi:nitrite reductase (NO-forming)
MMRATNRRLVLVSVALAAATVIAVPLAIRARSSEPTQAGPTQGGPPQKVWGTPRAEIFQETQTGGPLVEGDAVTFLPNIAELKPGNRTHQVRLDIVAQEIEIADGVRFQAWTFGGSVPGPVVHVREGDRIDFVMRNRSDEQVSASAPGSGDAPFLAQLAAASLQKPTPAVMPMPHSMDFHAATVAADDKWRMIMPGQSIRFEWVANYPGVYMYHCGVPPVLQHVAMGQYGIVIVSPRDGYPTDADTARRYAVVQSEFYLKPNSETGLYDLDYDAALRKQPSHVLFNGHASALTTHPLMARAGDRVRLYFHNAGPNDQSSTHVIGAIFDRVYYEGNPGNEMRGMQTALIGSSNGAVLEFIAAEAGRYILVDHEFADASKGAVGQIVAMPETGPLTSTATVPMKH